MARRSGGVPLQRDRQRPQFPAPTECLRGACAIAAGLWRAEQAWRDALATVTLDTLATGVGELVPPEVMDRNAGWPGARVGRA